MRTIKLPKVAGFSRSTLIPSDDRVYVQYRNERDQVVILELDANTGEELRRIEPGGLEERVFIGMFFA